MAYNYDFDKTKFNAGIQVALDVNNIILRTEYWMRLRAYGDMFIEQNILASRLIAESEARGKTTAIDEIKKSRTEAEKPLRVYLKKSNQRSRVPTSLSNDVSQKLEDYGVVLKKWVKKLGFGMPTTDSRFGG